MTFSEQWLSDYQARMAALKGVVIVDTPGLPPKPARESQGRRPDLDNRFFRSSWEANYARYLNWLVAQGEILRWDYEVDTFWFEAIRRGVRSYKPDFKIWPVSGEPYYVEVKGYMDPRSKTKLKRMAKYHPGVRVDLVTGETLRGIARAVGPMLTGWERGKVT